MTNTRNNKITRSKRDNKVKLIITLMGKSNIGVFATLSKLVAHYRGSFRQRFDRVNCVKFGVIHAVVLVPKVHADALTSDVKKAFAKFPVHDVTPAEASPEKSESPATADEIEEACKAGIGSEPSVLYEMQVVARDGLGIAEEVDKRLADMGVNIVNSTGDVQRPVALARDADLGIYPVDTENQPLLYVDSLEVE